MDDPSELNAPWLWRWVIVDRADAGDAASLCTETNDDLLVRALEQKRATVGRGG